MHYIFYIFRSHAKATYCPLPNHRLQNTNQRQKRSEPRSKHRGKEDYNYSLKINTTASSICRQISFPGKKTLPYVSAWVDPKFHIWSVHQAIRIFFVHVNRWVEPSRMGELSRSSKWMNACRHPLESQGAAKHVSFWAFFGFSWGCLFWADVDVERLMDVDSHLLQARRQGKGGAANQLLLASFLLSSISTSPSSVSLDVCAESPTSFVGYFDCFFFS